MLSFVACVGKDAEVYTADPNDAGGGDAGNGGADSAPGEDGGNTVSDGASGDGAIPTKPGDIVVLEGSGIVGATGAAITQWNSTVNGVAAKPTATAPTITTYSKKPSERCVVFGGERPLAIAESPAIDIVANQDFSVTVVAIRGKSLSTAPDPQPDHGRVIVARNVLGPGYAYQGFALMSDWQDGQLTLREPRWAARILWNPGSVVEVKGEYRPVDYVREVVTMYRRGNDLYLRDGSVAHAATQGVGSYSMNAGPLTIGQADDENDPATRFEGTICAIVVHRGDESDADIAARIAALEAKYPTQ